MSDYKRDNLSEFMTKLTAKQRLFVEAGLSAGERIELTGNPAHYLSSVMRKSPGDGVLLFNGRDGEWLAAIETIAKKRCTLVIESQTREQSPASDLWLAFAPLKKSRIDFLVEKATELGVSRLIPVFTQHTATTRIKGDRLAANAIEAAEQCRRLEVPTIADETSFTKFIEDWPRERTLFVMDETGNGTPIAKALAAAAEKSSPPCHGILTGPEGGFAASELDALAKLPFVTTVDLGQRILRAETAALSAIACWQSLIGDWQS